MPEPQINGSAAAHSISNNDYGLGNEAIAIVGMGMRLPGGIHTSEALWKLLAEKQSTRGKVPPERFNIEAFYSPSGKRGSMKAEYAHFLASSDSLDHIDTSMFSMRKKEVEIVDPQAKMLLEVVFECMQNGGQKNWCGGDIGCFVGSFGEDWSDLFAKDPQAGRTGIQGPQRTCGQHDYTIANRCSYEYDLKGPSYVVKAACSSSLVALHDAVRSVRSGDCASAIVCGTSLIFTPTASMAMHPALSPDGMCKSFDASANGYARGEAINAIYIKRFSDAVRDSDPIRAIIRGTATNFDGKTPGITMPSTAAHERLMRKAYEDAHLDPCETPFIDAHGTGTLIGDPLEANAIGRVFGGQRGVYIGSVKPNLGHGEGAGGINSVLKMVLALENQMILPNIFFETPNPKIEFKETNMKVPTSLIPWPKDQAERAGVNSFGISGANAHVILESARSFGITPVLNGSASDSCASQGDSLDPHPTLIVLSAASSESLHKSIAEHEKYIAKKKSLLRDISYTLCCRRDHLPYRAFCVNTGDTQNFSSPVKHGRVPQITMIFTGQGAVWGEMGKELISAFPTFSDDIDSLNSMISDLSQQAPDWNIKEELLKPESTSRLAEAEYAQPATTAIQIALVNLLESWGVLPSTVIGHSSGEIAAAYTAKTLTAKEAMVIAYYRGQVAKSIKGGGGMAAVGLGRDEVMPFLRRGVVVACENSPSSVTLSGDRIVLWQIGHDIEQKEPGTFFRPLKVAVAYHSHEMHEVGSTYEEHLSAYVQSKAPTIPFLSTVTGKIISQAGEANAAYWRSNLEQPVLFNTTFGEMLQGQSEDQVLLEIGPHGALAAPIRQILSSISRNNDNYIAAMTRGGDCHASLLDCVGRLHVLGIPVSLETFIPKGKVLTDLPLYQWSHAQSHWSETRVVSQWRFRKFPHHELLGSRTMESSDIQPEWRNVLSLQEVPWLQDHVIGDDVILPFAGYIGMAEEATRQIADSDTCEIRNMTVMAALMISHSGPIEMITSLRPVRLTSTLNSTWWEFTIVSYNGKEWTKHCTGELKPGVEPSIMVPQISQYSRKVPRLYSSLAKLGLRLGPAFQGLEDVTAMPGGMTASASLQVCPKGESKYALHPTEIDCCLQVLGIAGCEGVSRRIKSLVVPVAIDHIYIAAPKSANRLSVEATALSNSTKFSGNVTAVNSDGLVFSCNGLTLVPIRETESDEREDTIAGAMIEWKPDVEFLDIRKARLELREILGLLGHKTPTLKVLCIAGEGILETAVMVLKELSPESGRKYGTFTFADRNATKFEETKAALSQFARVECQILDLGNEKIKHGLPISGFDLIITPIDKVRSQPDTPARLHALLHSEGWLLLHGRRSPAPHHFSLLNHEFRSSGFEAINKLESQNDSAHGTVYMLTRPSRVAIPVASRLTLLYRGENSPELPMVLALCKKFSDSGTGIDLHTLKEPLPLDQDIISLLEIEQPFFDRISEADFASFKDIVRGVGTRNVLWVTRSAQLTTKNPSFGLCLGLSRTLRQELGLNIATLELCDACVESMSVVRSVWARFQARVNEDWIDSEYEFAIKNGVVHVGRYQPFNVLRDLGHSADHNVVENWELDIGTRGLWQTLVWRPTKKRTIGREEVLISPRCAGINFKDILISMGILEGKGFGVEGSGIITEIGAAVKGLSIGERVCYWGTGCLSTSIAIPAPRCAKIPWNIAFDEAATLPCVFATAIYCLLDIGRLQKCESVLIHSASGGVGIAAIQICQNVIGAEIFVTVGSDEKVQYIMDTFNISKDHIFNSRDASFLPAVLSATRNRGVDLVLNSLSGELLHESWKCVAEGGRMVEIGKRDLIGKARLDMNLFDGNRSFFGVDLSTLDEKKSSTFISRTTDFLNSGLIKPITPMTVFSSNNIEEAFRYMQKGDRIGKVVVTMPADGRELAASKSVPELNFRDDACYLLVGGLGGIGRAVSIWMIEHGAKNLIFLSRSAGKSEKDKAFLRELESEGCHVQAISGSVADPEIVKHVVEVAVKPIKGIFQLSMALPDSQFLDMNYSDWQEGLTAKVAGTWNLHRLLPSNLDFFVLASSIGGCFGQPGEASYASANTFLNSFVNYRHAENMPASVVDIGTVGDIGYIGERPSLFDGFRAAGSHFLYEADVLASLHWAIVNSKPTSKSRSHISIGIRSQKPLSASDNHLLWIRDRRIAVYHNQTTSIPENSLDDTSTTKMFITEPFRLNDPSALRIMTRELGGRIYRAMMKPIEEMQPDQSLQELGVDSLALIELRNWVKRNLGGADLGNLDSLKSKTIEEISMVAIDAMKKKLLPTDSNHHEDLESITTDSRTIDATLKTRSGDAVTDQLAEGDMAELPTVA